MFASFAKKCIDVPPNFTKIHQSQYGNDEFDLNSTITSQDVAEEQDN